MLTPLGLQAVSRYGRQLRIGLNLISSRGQLTRGGTPPWEFGVQVTSFHCKMFRVPNLYKVRSSRIFKDIYNTLHYPYPPLFWWRLVFARIRWTGRRLYPLRYLCRQDAATSDKTTPNFVVEWLTLLFRIREVPCSDFDPEAGYPDWG
jgi:hypothetical protein